MKGSFICCVKGRDSEQSAGGDFGDADNDSPVVIYLEFRTDLGIVELVEFCVLNYDKCVFCIDVLNFSLYEFRPAKQTGIVQP